MLSGIIQSQKDKYYMIPIFCTRYLDSESKVMVARGCERGMESWCLVGTEFQLGKMNENIPEMEGANGTPVCSA